MPVDERKSSIVDLGAGDDVAKINSGPNIPDPAIKVEGGAGNDTIELAGSSFTSLVGIGPSFTVTDKEGGNDSVTLIAPELGFPASLNPSSKLVDSDLGSGNDFVKTGAGNDSFETGSGADQVDSGGGRDNVSGGANDDLIKGGLGNDVLSGDGGNDQISGGGGNDQISGGDGADTIVGGSGDDIITPGSGNDHVSGDEGLDIFVFGENDDSNIIRVFETQFDKIDLTALGLTAEQGLAAAADSFVFGRESTKISFDEGNTEIILFNTDPDDLTEDNFIGVDDAVG